MEAARAAGNLEALQAAAEAAKALGLGNEAQRELTAFEEASRAASGTLLRASQVLRSTVPSRRDKREEEKGAAG